MSIRSINSPGVEIREAVKPTANIANISSSIALVMGYATKGEALNPIKIFTLRDFINYFGEPTTDYEFYFYNAVNSIIKENGEALCIRIPYNNVMENNYKHYQINLASNAVASGIILEEVRDVEFKDYIIENGDGPILDCGFTNWKTYTNDTGNYVTCYSVASGYVDDTIVMKQGSDYYAYSYGITIESEEAFWDFIPDVSGTGVCWISGAGSFYDPYIGNWPSGLVEPLRKWDSVTKTITLSSEINSIAPGETIEYALWNTVGPAGGNLFVDFITTSGAGIVSGEDKFTNEIVNNSYDELITIESYSSSLPVFMLTNEHKATSTGPNKQDGLFCIVITENHRKIIQRLDGVTDDYELSIITQGEIIGTFDKPLSGKLSENTYSYDFAAQYPHLDEVLDYSNVITLIVAETVTKDTGKIHINILEKHVGSIKDIIHPVSKQSFFIGDIVNRDSKYITVFKDPTFDLTLAALSGIIPYGIHTLTFTEAQSTKTITTSAVIDYVQQALYKIEDDQEYVIDLVVDAGLSTIASTNSLTDTLSYDSTKWQAIVEAYKNFCEHRRDCIALVDVPRSFELENNLPIIRKTNPNRTIINTIIPKLKDLILPRSSFIVPYMSWMKDFNYYTNLITWTPPSSKAVAPYIRNDKRGNIFHPPAGLNYGTLSNVSELPFIPTKREADLIYNLSFNYATKTIKDGPYLLGDQTFLDENSAFSSIHNRRLMCKIYRFTYQTMRYFVFEPNNTITRQTIVSQIETLLKYLYDNKGIYDYKIVCDETNNTTEVIDKNQLVVSIGIKFNKHIKFIIVDFIVNRT